MGRCVQTPILIGIFLLQTTSFCRGSIDLTANHESGKKNPGSIHEIDPGSPLFFRRIGLSAPLSTKSTLYAPGRSSDLRFALLSAPSRFKLKNSGVVRISSPNTAAGLSPIPTEFPIKLSRAPECRFQLTAFNELRSIGQEKSKVHHESCIDRQRQSRRIGLIDGPTGVVGILFVQQIHHIQSHQVARLLAEPVRHLGVEAIP